MSLKRALEGNMPLAEMMQLPEHQRLDVLKYRHKVMNDEELNYLINSLPSRYGPELLLDIPEATVIHYENLPVYTLQLMVLEYPGLAHRVKYKLWQDTISELIKKFPGHAVNLTNVLSDSQIDALIDVVPGSVARKLTNLLSYKHINRYVRDKKLQAFAKHTLKHRLSFDQVIELRLRG